MRIDLNNVARLLMIFVAAFLIFGGPTYVVYVTHIVLPYAVSVVIGLALFVVGIILLVRLIGKDMKLEPSQ